MSALFLVIVVLVQIFFPHFFPALFTSIVRPFWRADFSINSGSLNSQQTLLAENESLRLQLEEAKVRLQTVGEVELENAELKSFFGIATKNNENEVGSASTSYSIFTGMLDSSMKNKRVLAPVLVTPGIGIYDELIIDGGKDMGFAVGSKIYAPGDILIGTISDVLPETSKASLYSSPGNILGVFIGPSNAPASAIGQGGGQYSAELPRTGKISAGDFVIVPSISDKPFGVVSEVISNPSLSFETILFAPPVNIYQLRWVLVEKK